MTTPSSTIVLKATYVPVAGSDVEHGQGAIERADLPHAIVAENVWFIRVPLPASCEEWTKRLSEIAGAHYGTFEVVELSPEEQARVDRGEVEFQQ